MNKILGIILLSINIYHIRYSVELRSYMLTFLLAIILFNLIFYQGKIREFRKSRALMRERNQKLDSLELANFLDKYAATGTEYTKIIKKIIEQNALQDFDKVKLLPTSIQLKNII